jgi:broad specificity phosphatase PhoE
MIAASGAIRALIVSHEMIGRMLLRNLLGLTPAEALALSQAPGTVRIVQLSAS